MNNAPFLPVSRRVGTISISATKAMALQAARIGGCVSLGQGVPSFATPPEVVNAVIETLRNNPASGKYTLQTGLPELRHRIARYLREEKCVEVDPESEICVTVGGMEGLLATMLTVVDQEDEVILPSPTYASYIEQVHLAGGIPVFVPLNADWSLNLEAIRKAITPRTKALMLCNPGNPTGTVFTDEAICAICDLAVAGNFTVVCDETYDYLVYEGNMPLSPLSREAYRKHVVCVASLSKKYALTGWRVGWVTAQRSLMEHIMKVHDATAICAPTPSQYAALAALNSDPAWTAECRTHLARRRDLCCQRLSQLPDFFSYVAPKGAFYVMARYLFSDEPSQDVASRLLQGARVITIPGGSFGLGGERHLRLSFGGEEAEINEAFDRIERWLDNGY
jgi:aminotransferase